VQKQRLTTTAVINIYFINFQSVNLAAFEVQAGKMQDKLDNDYTVMYTHFSFSSLKFILITGNGNYHLNFARVGGFHMQGI